MCQLSALLLSWKISTRVNTHYTTVSSLAELEAGLGIPSFTLSLFALSLKLLFFKSDCERFALVTLFKKADMSESLSVLFTKKRPWAICSCHSFKKRGHEGITLSALYKKATVSESLSSLLTKEQQWPNRSLQESDASKSLLLQR